MSVTTKKVAIDKAGRAIRTGDFIVYGHALGRSSGLRYGKVLAISQQEPKAYERHSDHHFRVQGVDDDWRDVPSLLSRKGTLQFSNRLLVLSREQVPETILALLDTVKHEEQP